MADERSRGPPYGTQPVYVQPYMPGPQSVSPYAIPDVPQRYAMPGTTGPYPPPMYPPPPGGQVQSYGFEIGGTSAGGPGKEKPPRMMSGVRDGETVEQQAGKCQDLWAAILFVMHFIAIAILAVVLGGKGLKNGFEDSSAPPSKTNDVDTEAREVVPQLVVAALVSFVFAWLWLLLTRNFPKAMVTFALWGGVVAFGFAAVVSIVLGKQMIRFAIVFAIIAVIQAVYAFLVRHRIPFAAALLGKVTSVVKKFPATIVVSCCSVFFLIAWYALWAFGAVGAWTQTRAALVVFLLLVSLYWTLEVVRNVVHVTVAGAMATFYFQEHNMPPNPTRNALGRAMTKSFGSICLGSLMVALIQALRTMVRMAAGRDGEEMNPFLASCLLCILNLIEWLVQYFNKYAFVQVIESGVVTYYVCFAEDPATLERNDPQFFQVLQQRRDQAQQ
ncbi:hypothetical protein CBR_g546 [Chara braunii]|uniref:Choline transporter-like protein n=1 Tax=Chara braunii TaxID=69332 RepID=A0A388KBI7_CHABU|nr:hypothetical protein CBR_g546 [Chara braunii]|eukprot:GBG67410.1 hypothetical protein CBR_g546 [Chara braunii]